MSVYRVRINTYLEGPPDLQQSWSQEQILSAIIRKISDDEVKIVLQKLLTPEEVLSQLSEQHRQHQATIKALKDEHQLQLRELLEEEQEIHLKKIQEYQSIIDNEKKQVH